MMVRSMIVLTAAVAVVGVTACSAETVDENVVGSAEGTAQTSATYGALDPGYGGSGTLDPSTGGTFSCKCGTPGPNGGFLHVNEQGQCVEETKACCPTLKNPYVCPPSRLISVWNPCYGSTPYYRCNVYGDCYCSSYP